MLSILAKGIGLLHPVTLEIEPPSSPPSASPSSSITPSPWLLAPQPSLTFDSCSPPLHFPNLRCSSTSPPLTTSSRWRWTQPTGLLLWSPLLSSVPSAPASRVTSGAAGARPELSPHCGLSSAHQHVHARLQQSSVRAQPASPTSMRHASRSTRVGRV